MFQDITSVENLLEAWREFLRGKRSKPDVQEFGMRLMDNIFLLHRDLVSGTYRHGPYRAFNISDPKPRNIHKATVRDRLLHRAAYRILYPYFSRRFIADSFSCQEGKGTHKALNRFRAFGYKVGRNHTRTAWVLKCDIKKFFANIDHATLLEILQPHLDEQTLRLVNVIVGSFHSIKPRVGLPLGNLTSQLFVNVYMNEFDQHVKHKLKVKHYLRYADDFAVFSRDRKELEVLLLQMEKFLCERLKLELHPAKISLRTLASGVDFLGWLHFPDHRVLRTATKRRMLRRVRENSNQTTIDSYLGLLKHGNAQHLKSVITKHSLT